jgi:hypothetical protein
MSLTVEIGLEDSDDEELNSLTAQLLDELSELPVESVDQVKGGMAPEGAKGDPLTIGSLALVVLPAFLPKIVDFCQAWALRGQGRTVKFKGKVGGQDIEFEGRAEDLQRILSMLTPPPPAGATLSSPAGDPAAPQA